jgi:hypothetical protein
MGKNWRTTLAGILTLVAAGAYLGKKILAGQALTGDDLAVVVAALSGAGLIAAKDGNK